MDSSITGEVSSEFKDFVLDAVVAAAAAVSGKSVTADADTTADGKEAVAVAEETKGQISPRSVSMKSTRAESKLADDDKDHVDDKETKVANEEEIADESTNSLTHSKTYPEGLLANDDDSASKTVYSSKSANNIECHSYKSAAQEEQVSEPTVEQD